MEKLKRDKRGITLVALVVTIVILLILAGVSLNLVLSNNGIIKKAGDAKEKTVIGQEKEQVEMAYISAVINKLGGNVTVIDLQAELDILVKEDKTEVTKSNDRLYVTFEGTKHYYEVDEGRVNKVSNIPEYTGLIITAENASEYGITYTDASGNTKDFNDEVQDGDIVVCGDYEYRYNVYIDSYNDVGEAYTGSSTIDSSINGWSVLLISSNLKESYSEICGNILNKNVTNVSRLFGHCYNLVESPEIPNTVTNMSYTFYGTNLLNKSPKIPKGVTNMQGTYYSCRSLKEGPEIPESVENLSYTFWNCTSLTTAPTIPSSVTDMDYTFAYCRKLQGTIEINANPTSYTNCFSGAATEGTGLVVTGSSTMLDTLIGTKSSTSNITKGI